MSGGTLRDQVIAIMTDVHDRVIKLANKAFEDSLSTHRAARDKAASEASRAFDEAIATARHAHNQAIALAEREFRENLETVLHEILPVD